MTLSDKALKRVASIMAGRTGQDKRDEDLKVLSIDAWAEPSDEGDEDNEYRSWTWNAWYDSGSISREEFESLKTDEEFINWFIENGYVNERAKSECEIDDDNYNVVLVVKKTGEPLYAIEYGPHY